MKGKMSEQYTLNHAFAMGCDGAYNYHPRTPEQREAYSLGIAKWMESFGIRGIDPAELANGSVLKGFIYGLLSQPVRKFLASHLAFLNTFGNEDSLKMFKESREEWEAKSRQVESLEMYLRKEAARKIRECLREYNAYERFGEEIKEEGELFKKGLRLVEEYIERSKIENFIEGAKRDYGIDPEKLSPKRLKRYSDIDSDLSKIIAHCNEGQHYMLVGIELYHSKSNELDESLIDGDLNRALEITDYLRLLLDQLDLDDRGPKISLVSTQEVSDDEEEKDPEKRKQEISDMLNRSLQEMRDNDVVVRVDDSKNGIATQSFTINVADVNDAPVITSTPVLTVNDNENYVYDVDASDADNDVLVYSLTTSPTGITINANNGVITWTPTSSQVGDNNEEEKDPEKRKQEISDMLNRSLQEMRDNDERADWDDETIEAVVQKFEISHKIRKLKETRKDIIERMENPAYDLEQRRKALEQKMNDLVALERYEEAAKIRDKLKRLC